VRKQQIHTPHAIISLSKGRTDHKLHFQPMNGTADFYVWLSESKLRELVDRMTKQSEGAVFIGRISIFFYPDMICLERKELRTISHEYQMRPDDIRALRGMLRLALPDASQPTREQGVGGYIES
jgi:hypothetical protein